MAKNSKNKMKQKVSQLFAVTRLAPYKIVRSRVPWEDRKLVRITMAGQPLSGVRMMTPEPSGIAPDVFTVFSCWTILVPPKTMGKK